MKTKGKKLFFVSVIIIVVILMISSPFLISYFYLPTQVRIFAGEEHLFNFEMPFEASFKSDVKKLHLEDVNHKPIQDEKVNLSKPFYMTINDEVI